MNGYVFGFRVDGAARGVNVRLSDEQADALTNLARAVAARGSRRARAWARRLLAMRSKGVQVSESGRGGG